MFRMLTAMISDRRFRRRERPDTGISEDSGRVRLQLQFLHDPARTRRKQKSGPDECLDQARMLVSQGSREIVLTGVNVGDYRKAARDCSRFFAILSGSGTCRIQDQFDRAEPACERSAGICRSIPSDVPSFSHSAPKRKRRGPPFDATALQIGHYADLVHRIKRRIPDCGIGMDVITGFPGETDAHFESTCRLYRGSPGFLSPCLHLF